MSDKPENSLNTGPNSRVGAADVVSTLSLGYLAAGGALLYLDQTELGVTFVGAGVVSFIGSAVMTMIGRRR